MKIKCSKNQNNGIDILSYFHVGSSSSSSFGENDPSLSDPSFSVLSALLSLAKFRDKAIRYANPGGAASECPALVISLSPCVLLSAFG